MSSKKREKGLILATAAVIIGAILFTFVVEPQLKEHDRLRKRLEALEMQALRIKQDLSTRHHIEGRHSALVLPLAETVSGDSGQQVLAQQLSRLCQEHGLIMRSLQGLPAIDEGAYQILSLKLDLQGYVAQFLRFVEALEKIESPLRIVRFDLEAGSIVDSINASLVVTKLLLPRST